MNTETMPLTKWAIDPTHSELQFKVRHLMISTVTGRFKSFTAEMESEGEDFTTAQVKFSAETSSVDTGSEQRDGHLKSADFFDVEKFPMLEFQSSLIEKSDEKNYIMQGLLSIRGLANPVKLQVEYAGKMKDPWGNEKAGFTLRGKINRSEWNLNWNAALETGGFLLSDEIRIEADIQMVSK